MCVVCDATSHWPCVELASEGMTLRLAYINPWKLQLVRTLLCLHLHHLSHHLAGKGFKCHETWVYFWEPTVGVKGDVCDLGGAVGCVVRVVCCPSHQDYTHTRHYSFLPLFDVNTSFLSVLVCLFRQLICILCFSSLVTTIVLIGVARS